MVSVLVVDDEADYPQLLSLLLAKEGFDVRAAASVQQALEQFARFVPDVLIVDWMLGGSDDGLTLAETLRAQHPQLRTILITGYPSPELEARAARLPATRFLPKPFEPAELVTLVRSAVESGG